MSSTSRPPNVSMDLAPNHPHQPEEEIPPFAADADIDSTPLDAALRLPERKGEYSPLLLGCATFGYGVYTAAENVRTPEPLRIVRAALEAGINGFDTCEWARKRGRRATFVVRARARDRRQTPNAARHDWGDTADTQRRTTTRPRRCWATRSRRCAPSSRARRTSS